MDKCICKLFGKNLKDKVARENMNKAELISVQGELVTEVAPGEMFMSAPYIRFNLPKLPENHKLYLFRFTVNNVDLEGVNCFYIYSPEGNNPYRIVVSGGQYRIMQNYIEELSIFEEPLPEGYTTKTYNFFGIVDGLKIITNGQIVSGGSGEGGGTKLYLHTVTFGSPTGSIGYTVRFLDKSNVPFSDEWSIPKTAMFLSGEFLDTYNQPSPDANLQSEIMDCRSSQFGFILEYIHYNSTNTLLDNLAMVTNFVDTVTEY